LLHDGRLAAQNGRIDTQLLHLGDLFCGELWHAGHLHMDSGFPLTWLQLRVGGHCRTCA